MRPGSLFKSSRLSFCFFPPLGHLDEERRAARGGHSWKQEVPLHLSQWCLFIQYEGGLTVSVYVSFEKKLSGTFIQSFDLSLPVEREKNWVSQERGGEFTAMRSSSLSSLNCNLFVITFFLTLFFSLRCQLSNLGKWVRSRPCWWCPISTSISWKSHRSPSE